MTHNRKHLQTSVCVKCLINEADTWTGYVVKGDLEILAGWCGQCGDSDLAFVGHYRDEMGVEEQ